MLYFAAFTSAVTPLLMLGTTHLDKNTYFACGAVDVEGLTFVCPVSDTALIVRDEADVWLENTFGHLSDAMFQSQDSSIFWGGCV